MRRMVVETLVLALVLSSANMGLGQQQPGAAQQPPPMKEKTAPVKSKLEEMLTEALKNNPDIRVAAARVAKADAELNRTSLQVTQQVIVLYYAIDTQKKTLEHEEAKLNRVAVIYKRGQGGREDLEVARQAFRLARAKLAELEAQMPALLGKAVRGSKSSIESVAFSSHGGLLLADDGVKVRIWDASFGKNYAVILAPRKAAGPMTDRIYKALQTSVTVNYKDAKLSEMLADLQKKAPGLVVRDFSGRGNDTRTLQFKEALPVSAILQAIGDYFELSFTVREYGILVTEAKAVPPGAITVQEFLRQKQHDETQQKLSQPNQKEKPRRPHESPGK